MRLPLLNRFSASFLHVHRPAGWIVAALLGAMLGMQPAMAQDPLVGAEYRKVQQLMGSGNLTGATQAADAWLAANPRDPQMRMLKSRILTAQGQKDQARAVLVALTQEYPEIPEPFNNLAVLYAESGELGLARESLEAALRSNPGYATALENLGDVYRRMAHDSYSRALALQPGNAALRAKLAAAGS